MYIMCVTFVQLFEPRCIYFTNFHDDDDLYYYYIYTQLCFGCKDVFVRIPSVEYAQSNVMGKNKFFEIFCYLTQLLC